jgi:hypothetical protein
MRILSLVLAIPLFVACGSEKSERDSAKSPDETKKEEVSESKKEPVAPKVLIARVKLSDLNSADLSKLALIPSESEDPKEAESLFLNESADGAKVDASVTFVKKGEVPSEESLQLCGGNQCGGSGGGTISYILGWIGNLLFGSGQIAGSMFNGIGSWINGYQPWYGCGGGQWCGYDQGNHFDQGDYRYYTFNRGNYSYPNNCGNNCGQPPCGNMNPCQPIIQDPCVQNHPCGQPRPNPCVPNYPCGQPQHNPCVQQNPCYPQQNPCVQNYPCGQPQHNPCVQQNPCYPQQNPCAVNQPCQGGQFPQQYGNGGYYQQPQPQGNPVVYEPAPNTQPNSGYPYGQGGYIPNSGDPYTYNGNPNGASYNGGAQQNGQNGYGGQYGAGGPQPGGIY